MFLEAASAVGKRAAGQALAPGLPRATSKELQVCAIATPASSLFFVHDDLSGRDFLVDTGACVSLFPFSSRDPPSRRDLRTADGSFLPAWGNRRMQVRFGGKEFRWRFLLAAVDTPILGVDFLSAHRLVVDTAARQLLHAATFSPIFAVSSAPPAAAGPPAGLPPGVKALLDEFAVIEGKDFSDIKPLHGVEHHIVTVGPPCHAKARRLDPVKLAAAQAEFRRMERAGIIRRSSSQWASPLHIVTKPDGSMRPCGDYRILNNQTQPDRYPVPHVHDFSARLHGATVFSKIDLVKGYYQVPMAPADVPKTAVITPFGCFEWLFMPFGLRNSGNTFQRLMDRVGMDLPFVFVYLDDVLIASPDLATHLVHLRRVLERLREFGLVYNPAKCIFAKPSVPFLGHEVSAAGIKPLTRHVEAVASYPPPADKPALQRFLGLVNFFRRFIPGAAGILRPLTDALRASASGFAWTADMDAAFAAAKRALVSAAVLRHPDPAAPLSLSVDASLHHVGGVLQQWERGGWAPLAFFSRKLSPAETRYSVFDRELLAAFSAVRHFRFLLEGRRFTLFSDHRR